MNPRLIEIVPVEELKHFAENVLGIYETNISGMDKSNQYLKMTGPFAKGLELVISGRVMLDTSLINKRGGELTTFVFVQDERSHRAVSKKIPVVINYQDYKTNILLAVQELKSDKAKGLINSTFNKTSQKKLSEIYDIPMYEFDPFLISLAESVRTYGSLTPAQETALQNAKDRYTPKVPLSDAQKAFLTKLQNLPSYKLHKREKETIRNVYAKSCRGQPWTEEDRSNTLDILNKNIVPNGI